MTTSRTIRVLRAVKRVVLHGLARSCMESAAFWSCAPTYMLYSSDFNSSPPPAEPEDPRVPAESSAPLSSAELRSWAELVRRLQLSLDIRRRRPDGWSRLAVVQPKSGSRLNSMQLLNLAERNAAYPVR